ncbi:MAG: cardiolipin synthase [Streptococcaceae bacterium]|nr:cardiolipin synthase [Streptococcaceae bacterium]
MHFIFGNSYIFVLIVNLFLSLVIIFRERKQTSSTWAWLLILVFIPIVGFILYTFLGRGISHTRLFDLKIQRRIGGLDDLKKQQEDVQKISEVRKKTEVLDELSLIYMLTLHEQAYFSEDNDIKLFTDGTEKFDALIEDINLATDTINMEYYIFRMDNLGKRVYQALLAAQKRGVEVRVLLDAWGSNGVKRHDFSELINAGGEVVFFFPLFLPWINPRLNYRNHRKIVVIDGRIAYTGGFNVGDEYLGAVKKFGYWRDNHLRIIGRSVYSLQNRFIMDWNSQEVAKIQDIGQFFPEITHEGHMRLQVVTSGPDTMTQPIKMTYLKMINLAKQEILIQTPYYIPDDAIHESLKLALMSGVKVRLMIPNKPDHIFVYWATYSLAAELIEYGAIVETYEPGFIHAKTMIIDQQLTSIGSANIDNRSFALDFEVNTIIYNDEFAEIVRKKFCEDEQFSNVLTQEIYAARSNLIKIKEGLARLIAPLL